MQANAILIIANNIMQSIHERISGLIDRLKLNPKTFAEAIGVNPAVIYNIIGGRFNKPSFDVMQKIFIAFAIVNPEWLLLGKGEPFVGMANKKAGVEDTQPEYRKNVHLNVHPNVHLTQKDKTKGTQKEVEVKPVMVTVDHTLNEVITFVPVKAQAGYLIGYGDPEYIKDLPAFGFPGFNHGTYRGFEVAGYSMLQYEGAGLYPKDIVVAEFVENPIQSIRDNRVYVVASDEGLLIKRCINRLEKNGKLICNSDNRNGDYPPHILDLHQVKEVWEFKMKCSRQIPKTTRVYEEITELQTQYTLMEAEMRQTNSQLLNLNRQMKIHGILKDQPEEE
jgi:hypothetical protein